MRWLPLLSLFLPALAHAQTEDAGAPFGELRIVDEIDCGDGADTHERMESHASRIETLTGVPTRVLPPQSAASFFAYRIGAGMGLEAGHAYVLAVEMPDDADRSFFVLNRGGELNRGVSTGAGIGDALFAYTAQNVESLRIPTSGASITFRSLFHMHDRVAGLGVGRPSDMRPHTPADGFWVALAQVQSSDAPGSAGAACSRIVLYDVPDLSAYDLAIARPPEGLPWRHVFYREEMADLAIAENDGGRSAFVDPLDWYRHQMERMRFYGIDTFAKDLLEFGYNQGWDPAPHGGNDWFYVTGYGERWGQLVDMAEEHGLFVLPYYEYSGPVGQRYADAGPHPCEPLGRAPYGESCGGYTGCWWCEDYNADLTDPAITADVIDLFDATISRFTDRASFLGAWLRARPTDLPVSFSEATRGRFGVEANGGVTPSREQIGSDEALRARYLDWWLGERRAFLMALRDRLRTDVGDDATLLFTAYPEEPGPHVGTRIVTDDPDRWRAVPELYGDVVPFDTYVGDDRYLSAITGWHVPGWTPPGCPTEEPQYSAPFADPEHYADVDGVVMTYPYHHLYSVSRASTIAPFRSPSGTAMIRHYSLNEDELGDRAGPLGYFAGDSDRAGVHSMLPEARAFANGDPRFLGFLAGNAFSRAFPDVVRRFHAAFLSLPAVPSDVMSGAASSSDVVVRRYETALGTWWAIVHTGLAPATGVTVTLPAGGYLDLVDGVERTSSGTMLLGDLAPATLIALRALEEGEELDASGRDGGTASTDAGRRDGGGTSEPVPGSCACRAGVGGGGGAALASVLLLVVLGIRRRMFVPLALLLAACDPAPAADAGPVDAPGADVITIDGGASDTPVPACGDGACTPGSEDCSSCEADCGACGPAACGDGVCTGGETCGGCASDCGLCDIAPGARRVCIGDGSGSLNHPDASDLGLTPGDVLCIRAGTYDGMDLGNLHGTAEAPITVVNEGAVAFTGGIRFHDLSHVVVRGDGDEAVPFGFRLHDIAYRAMIVDGAHQHVTWSHFALENIGDYAIFVDSPELIWDGTEETALTDLRFFDIRSRGARLGLFQIGSFRSWAARTSIVNGLEIARADIEGSQASCTIINASLSLDAHIHHNRIVNTGHEDMRHCGVIFLQGNGSVHHNEIRDFWGNATRAWCIGTPGHTTIDFYDNVVVGSRKYSGFEAQGFADDLLTAPATTCSFRIHHNTFGNLTALDFEAAMVDVFETAGSTVDVRNNLGFNIAMDEPFDPERDYTLNVSGGDRALITTGTNLHARTFAEVGLVDDVACMLEADSPAIDAGETISDVTTDIAGIARPQGDGYDLGAREWRE